MPWKPAPLVLLVDGAEVVPALEERGIELAPAEVLLCAPVMAADEAVDESDGVMVLLPARLLQERID